MILYDSYGYKGRVSSLDRRVEHLEMMPNHIETFRSVGTDQISASWVGVNGAGYFWKFVCIYIYIYTCKFMVELVSW